MKNQITIDSRIGYYDPRKNTYSWATVVGMEGDTITMEKKTGKFHAHRWQEKSEDVIKWLKTPSPDWHGKSPKMLLKHKGTNRNYQL